MKLKQTGEILLDNGKYKRIPCEKMEYVFEDYTLKLLLHASEQPWLTGMLDISEYNTGYRLTTTNKTVSSSSIKDVKLAMDEFISKHSIREIKDKIDCFLSSSDRVVEEWVI